MPQHITVFASENKDLWERFWLDGDVAALLRLFEKNNHEFSATCFGYLNDEPALEPKDVIADQIIKFIECRKSGKDYSQRKNPKSFIKVCLSNNCRSILRKKKLKPERGDVRDHAIEGRLGFREYESMELMKYLKVLLEHIENTETKQCRVFVNYLLDIRPREIAKRVGVEESYVYDSISKIRKKTFLMLLNDTRGRELIQMYPVFFKKYYKDEYRS